MALTMASTEAPAKTESHGVRVAVVDDSAVVRGLVARWVDEDPSLEVVGRFANGELAVNGITQAAPDVVVLDIEMPVMDGMKALPLLLEKSPGLQVIMASTLTRRNAEISLKALSLGAVDYIPKPEGNSGVTTSKDFRKDLVRKIKAVGQGRLRARARAAASERAPARMPATAASAAAAPSPSAPGAAPSLRKFSPILPRILVVGSSTGGPQALAKFMEGVGPAIGAVPVLVTQHMPATFTSILAEHLGRAANCESKEAENGEDLRPGVIYVAPGGLHMRLKPTAGNPVLEVYDGPEIHFCKPAVDPMFESVANIYGNATLGVVLTGMGHDGAAGATLIADKGGSIIAQDEATSVVWGMPGATAEAGAAAAILPLNDIAPKVTSLLRGGRK